MVVRRDFEALYRTEPDPWNIGDAQHQRYDALLSLVSRRSFPPAAKALDVGCGLGALTGRIGRIVPDVTGIELSAAAVERGRAQHPHVKFLQGDIRHIEEMALPKKAFHLITCMDTLYYLSWKEQRKALKSMRDLLRDDGCIVVGGWSPGGRYPTPEEFRIMTGEYFSIVSEILLDTQHVLFLAEKKFTDVVITIDYETWQPVPTGHRIDWDKDIFEPASRLLAVAGGAGVPLTFMWEMGEYFWLKEHDPRLAGKMENQLREAVSASHDVQLHLHPAWLPGLGARIDFDKEEYFWDPRYARIHDIPLPLDEILKRCTACMESLFSSARPGYRVVAYRAGKYQIQPAQRVFAAMEKAGLRADSSVWKGGHAPEYQFDFREAYSANTPYYANPWDINHVSPPAEEQILEVPIYTYNGERWTFDGAAWEAMVRPFVKAHRPPWWTQKAMDHLRGLQIVRHYLLTVPGMKPLTACGPFSLLAYGASGPGHVLVMIGHTKAKIQYDDFAGFLDYLSKQDGVRMRTLQEIVDDRIRTCRGADHGEMYRKSLEFQVLSDRNAVLGEERNTRISTLAQEKVPLDRRTILDLGCGAGYWTRKLSRGYRTCVGVDYGMEFLQKARNVHKVPVSRMDFHALGLKNDSFDCVYADNILEHAWNPQKVLTEVYRILADKGVLIALVPPDARNPLWSGPDHLWKTDSDEILQRLHDAGFIHVTIREINMVRDLGMLPYPPSHNIMLLISAWKRKGRLEYSLDDRLADLLSWCYSSLDPGKSQTSSDPEEILEGGFAWCEGYALVFHEACSREGIQSRKCTLLARNHPRGRGKHMEDSHEVVEVKVGDRWKIYDPTTNRILPHSLKDLLRNPLLAKPSQESGQEDTRWSKRRYDLYCSPFFYERVYRVILQDVSRRLRNSYSKKNFIKDTQSN